MQIRFFQGDIPEHGPNIALRFAYDKEIVANLKAAINRQRTYFATLTGKSFYQAGGWLAEWKIWYVALEIWPLVSAELTKKDYSFVQVASFEALLANNSYYSKQDHQHNKQQDSDQQTSPKVDPRFLIKDYELLGIEPSATSAEIKQAYRDLVEVWHPDRFTHNERLRKKAEEMTKRINAAYQRLRAVA
ncbi:MAG: J domain-containing protein [Acidobacteriota bacterium]